MKRLQHDPLVSFTFDLWKLLTRFRDDFATASSREEDLLLADHSASTQGSFNQMVNFTTICDCLCRFASHRRKPRVVRDGMLHCSIRMFDVVDLI